MNKNIQTITINDLTFFHNNEPNAKEIYEEIFRNKTYDIPLETTQPFIIDCGANIGLATIYFKKKFPKAEVLSFEPDPNNFQILQKNISELKFSKTSLINAAVSNKKGEINFFGEFAGENIDSRGNSIIADWGSRGFTQTIKIKSVRLSSFIAKTVDILKLDVEGAEHEVLTDLIQNNKLHFIQNIVCQCHETNTNNLTDNLKKVTTLLSDFQITIFEEDINTALPEKLNPWVKKTKPKLFIIFATKVICSS